MSRTNGKSGRTRSRRQQRDNLIDAIREARRMLTDGSVRKEKQTHGQED